MARAQNLHDLPYNLPIPTDDGTAGHLPGTLLPPIPLASTGGETVDLSALTERTVVYCYPMTGRPDRSLPAGWDEIPGARGCTPQSCSFRDHHAELLALGTRVFGLSTQDTEYQREAAARLRLPFALLSDENLVFAEALDLPTFEVEGMVLLKRLTLVIKDGRGEKVFYPVFPPDRSAQDIVEWLERQHDERVSDG
jgi:peroxiredoxin